MASPGPRGRRDGSFASAVTTDLGGFCCCFGDSFSKALRTLSVSVPNVTVCGSPTPTWSNTTESPACTRTTWGKYARNDSLADGLCPSTRTLNVSAACLDPPQPAVATTPAATTSPSRAHLRRDCDNVRASCLPQVGGGASQSCCRPSSRVSAAR